MWKLGLFLLAAIGLAGSFSGQTAKVVTPQEPMTSAWEIKETLPSGRELNLRFELVSSDKSFPGPRLIVPCNGPAEEANMKGWSGEIDLGKHSPDYSVSNRVSSALGVGGDAGDAGREIIRKHQAKVESEITQMVRVRPAEGSGPRPNEEVYQYGYQLMDLKVIIGVGPKASYSILSSFYVPVSQPRLESSRPCGSVPSQTACSFGGFGIQDAGGSVAMTPLPAVDRHPTGFIGAVIAPDIAEPLATSGFEITGVDVNAVTVTEPAAGPIKWIFLPSGTVLVPGKGGIQSMITVDPLLLSPAEFSDLTAEGLTTKNVAVHCLEIEKDPPNPAIKFTPSRPADPVYRNLALITQKSALKGPWDQARIWIYADKASLEKVNKRLAIGCPPGMYLRSLFEIYTLGGFTEKDLENTDLFRTDFLGAVSNRKEAAPWLASVLASRRPVALRDYLGGGAKELTALLTSTNPLASDQFARVMAQLLGHTDPAMRIAMLRLLDGQDAAILRKALPRPAPTWERHIQASGEESELGKRLKEKMQ
jgi:hypothetical protein